jgi:predicted RNase H-like nuclease (RuvC/YqgF family)
MSEVVERVDRLEESIHEFVFNVGIEFNKLYNSQMRTEAELRAFKDEMKEFKDEMKEFKDEMKEFKDEMKEFKDEMKEFKDEMGGFKDEMSDFKNESRQANREMNRRWGELANKMGTLVEDLVAPSLPRIVREVLGQEVADLSVRRKRKLKDGRTWEFDAIAITEGQQVGLNSTKSSLRSADVDHLVTKEVAAFREFFPEYAHYPVVGILASLAVEESVLNYAERQGLVVLGVGDELMEIKNRSGFTLKFW